MSRSGYSEDCDGWALIRWRGAVTSAIKGVRGQSFLRELLERLDAMPEKRLIAQELVTPDGEYCALGVVGAARGIDMTTLDPEDRESVARVFGIAPALAAEIVYENDAQYGSWAWANFELCGPMRPYEGRQRTVRIANGNEANDRWNRMREWAASNIAKVTGAAA